MGDSDDVLIRRKVEAQGAVVLRIKRLNRIEERSDPFDRRGSTTFYDVLVDTGGVHQTQVWRSGEDGVFPDY